MLANVLLFIFSLFVSPFLFSLSFSSCFLLFYSFSSPIFLFALLCLFLLILFFSSPFLLSLLFNFYLVMFFLSFPILSFSLFVALCLWHHFKLSFLFFFFYLLHCVLCIFPHFILSLSLSDTRVWAVVWIFIYPNAKDGKERVLEKERTDTIRVRERKGGVQWRNERDENKKRGERKRLV